MSKALGALEIQILTIPKDDLTIIPFQWSDGGVDACLKKYSVLTQSSWALGVQMNMN